MQVPDQPALAFYAQPAAMTSAGSLRAPAQEPAA